MKNFNNSIKTALCEHCGEDTMYLMHDAYTKAWCNDQCHNAWKYIESLKKDQREGDPVKDSDPDDLTF